MKRADLESQDHVKDKNSHGAAKLKHDLFLTDSCSATKVSLRLGSSLDVGQETQTARATAFYCPFTNCKAFS